LQDRNDEEMPDAPIEDDGSISLQDDFAEIDPKSKAAHKSRDAQVDDDHEEEDDDSKEDDDSVVAEWNRTKTELRKHFVS
jgi:hypothetical protein